MDLCVEHSYLLCEFKREFLLFFWLRLEDENDGNARNVALQ